MKACIGLEPGRFIPVKYRRAEKIDSSIRSRFVEDMKTFLANQTRPKPKEGDIVVVKTSLSGHQMYVKGLVTIVNSNLCTINVQEAYRIGIGNIDSPISSMAFTVMDISDFDPFDISLDD